MLKKKFPLNLDLAAGLFFVDASLNLDLAAGILFVDAPLNLDLAAGLFAANTPHCNCPKLPLDNYSI